MPSTLQPPVARRIPHAVSLHGETWDDPYYWLRDRSNPEVLAYLKAENEYLEQAMRHTQPLQEQLYAEMRGRIKEIDNTVPVQRGDYYYYSRQEQGKQYPICCRKHGSLDASEEVLLDQNQLAEGQSYFHLGVFKVSPNHQLLAYSIDTAGTEVYTIFVKDLASGALLPDQIVGAYYGVEWANDNRTLFYNTLDEALRPYKAFRHTLGASVADDVLVYHEADESFYLNVAKTRSNDYVLIMLESTTSTEARFVPADRPQADFAVVQPRRPDLEYAVAHHGQDFLIVTNDQAENFKLVAAPVATPGREYWREIIPHRPDVLVDGIDVFGDYLAVYERENGLKRIRISRPDGGEPRYVPFPEPVYTFTPGPNEEFATTTLRFTYSSLVTPDSVIDYDMRAGTWQQRKQDEIPSGYDPSRYQSERIYATAADGAHVPISLVYPKSITRDGGNPMLLYGYGAYGFTIDPGFDSKRLSLLDRGFVYAIAQVRGGSDLGRAWYNAGKLLHKRNSFTDLIACAEHLIAQGYTSKSRLAIMGGSAGGLLVGATVTMRPDLFKAVIAQVPFVDVINTQSDPSIPLVVPEYTQWGNPANKDEYEYMKSYSPYDNVAAVDYPHMFVTGGLNDPRVAYWEPAKWVAKLRATKTGQHLLLLRTNLSTGHFGASGRYDELKEVAQEYAFLIDVMGVGISGD
ncbi:MAG TPA: S9 family peptidase [Roseiflexaceae bacterium]|nr:S9 family peptidase [Roseiflexaceae bacterium]